ncbi:hypothetical protein M0805_006521 [Coniferiporia weirii]|nr:hypothetical protein M0805_006521 [Coniferiporia weirii]
MASPFFFIGKKDLELRACQDYHTLNEGTIKNAYPLPLISKLMDKLKGAKYFTKLDLHSGYNNIPIKNGGQWKAAFKTPSTFQAFMDDTFRIVILKDLVLIYMDDIFIFARSLKDLHCKTLQVLDICDKNDLYCKPEKCLFSVQEAEFLGMVITPNNINMDPVKLTGISDWPTPATIKQLHSFMGFCNYYRHFIPNFSNIVYPLNELMRTNKPWKWTPEHDQAFLLLKTLFLSKPALLIPDPTKPFILEMDTSKVTSSVVLYQMNSNGDLQPCSFISQIFGPAQQHYEVYDCELLGIV